MIIGIDGNEANLTERVGVHQYAFEILKSLYNLIGNEPNKHKVIVYLKNQPLGDLPRECSYWCYKIIPGSKLWIITKLMPELFLSTPKPTVFFAPHHYLPPLSPIPMVCTIHDLGYLKSSGQFKKYDFWQLRYWSAISIRISKAIISVSKSTRDDIVRHYNFASGKVSVIYHGYDNNRFNAGIKQSDVRRVKNKYTIVNEYLLFLSTLKPSKNIEGLLLAWAKKRIKLKDLTLVIAGKKGWLYDSIYQTVKKLNLESTVIFTDYVCENDKPALIAGARFFILPSFWEGFGMDILNSMACGTPVIASGVASLPEVVGDAGIYIDPYDINSLADSLEKAVTLNNVEYNKLVERGYQQVNKFSWDKAAKETLKVLESAI